MILEGTHVRLEPLNGAHFDDLCNVGLDPGLWRWTTSFVEHRDQLSGYTDQGRIRDTVYYSITVDDWPDVRERLEARLAAGGVTAGRGSPGGR